ncbi:hypothetical protein GCM10023232_18700 [Sphingosinicella ginsenosidimutans]|uniref:Uncharacterized protein n=1 Tax=Allosphingosinicella ginsenosidimutans TaxID=1176539 RepID=A0A5C6TRC9_9SPHN|nr:hypothetical protein [Sphingosinicella ginsenosidimutans]TXC62914.1 hypothetical protein FRZ32_04065 [Sphingosinicella ginsenosidimutans]
MRMIFTLKLTTALGLLALTACQQPQDNGAGLDNQALAEGAALPPLENETADAVAPGADALPAAAPIAYQAAPATAAGYAPIARADTLLETIGDAPPDYVFDYDGVAPYGWQTADDYRVYAEPIDDGYRYYYYAPDADAPFLVRDPGYSYGYEGGRLIAVYDSGGRYISGDAARRRAAVASRYYARARALRAASARDNRHAIEASRWARQQRRVADARRDWDRARARQVEWQAAQARQRADAAEQARRNEERRARAEAAQRFQQWRQNSFRGAPPRLYEPNSSRAARALAEREDAARRASAQRRAEAQRRQADERARRGQQARDHDARQQAERQRDARQRDAQQQRQAQQRDAQREAQQRQAQQREAQQRQAEQRQAQQREAQQRQAHQREAQRQAQQREAQQRQAHQREAQQRQAHQREAQQRQAQQREAQRQAQQREAQQRQARQRAEQAQARQRAAQAQARQHAEQAQAQARQRAAQARQQAARPQRQQPQPQGHARHAAPANSQEAQERRRPN